MKGFLRIFLQDFMKKKILGRSDAWSDFIKYFILLCTVMGGKKEIKLNWTQLNWTDDLNLIVVGSLKCLNLPMYYVD